MSIEFSSSQEELLKEFAEPTEDKNPGEAIEFEPENPTGPGASTPPPQIELEDIEEVVQDRPKNLLSPETSADLAVGAIDLLQSTIFTALLKAKVKKKVGGKEKMDEIQVVINEMEANAKDWNDLPVSDKAKVRIVERMKKKIKELPFEDDEYDKIHEALVLIIKDMPQYQLPPSLGLTIAISHAIIPRAVDILVD